MASTTKIEWTDATWNPITGCSVVSPGCTNCYAMRLAGTRLAHHPSRAGLTRDTKAGPVWTGEIRFNEQWLDQPLRWRRPRMIFVCAHGDLFAEGVPDEWIDLVFAVMALAPQHIFQVLTKRSERMRAYLTTARSHPVGLAALDQTMRSLAADPRSCVGKGIKLQGDIAHLAVWPLPNVWLGISAEDQRRADERVPHLLQTPAAVRWVSAEPLLGPIDFEAMPFKEGDHRHRWSALTGQALMHATGEDGHPDFAVRLDDPFYQHLDWIVAGGESGQGARPMHPDWVRAIRDQCAAAGTAFLFKQWGEWCPMRHDLIPVPRARQGWLREDGRFVQANTEDDLTAIGREEERTGRALYKHMALVGKQAAGRNLDGVAHDGFPEAVR